MNGVQHIEKVFAVICLDADNTEGIPALAGMFGPMPLVFHGEKNLNTITGQLPDIARGCGRPCSIVEFSLRRTVRRVDGNGEEMDI